MVLGSRFHVVGEEHRKGGSAATSRKSEGNNDKIFSQAMMNDGCTYKNT
jgi:hypothetical protein